MSSRVTDVLEQGGVRGRLGPVIVSFDHSVTVPKKTRKLKATLKHSFEEDAKTGKQKPQINLEVKSKHLTYSSNNEIAKSFRPSPYLRNFLAVRNRRTGLTRLIETNSVSLGGDVIPPKSTNPQVIASVQSKENPGNSDNEDEKKAKFRAARKALVQEFGQAKGKRLFALNDRMAIEENQLEKELEDAASKVDESAIVFSQQAAVQELTPNIHRDAKSRNSVYNLDDIVPIDERAILEKYAVKYKENMSITSKGDIKHAEEQHLISPLTGALMSQSIDDDEMFGMAIYVEAITRFLKKGNRTLAKGPSILNSLVPEAIGERIMNTFTTESRLDAVGRDRAICYMIVTSLLVTEFAFSYHLLVKSVKAKPEHLQKLVQVTGATLVTDELTGIRSVVLKLPLATFNTSSRRFKKKK